MFISICIPTYNSGSKLKRLLQSISSQSFTDYEIIVSDDSPGNGVKEIIDTEYSNLNIKYYHNDVALGTPNNWNNAVAKASGEWIKLMHHDDWFFDTHSLQTFATYAKNSNQVNFIFCSFQNYYLENGATENMGCSKWEIFLLKCNYLNLYKTFMGNPSCTLINAKCRPYSYDPRFKWLIDFDFYTDFFKKDPRFIYIDQMLVCLGMHSGQVTAAVFQNPQVEIPESIALLDKHGTGILKNILVYDFYWRLYRNINIRSMQQFNQYLQSECTYSNIIKMIEAQRKVSSALLKNGIISKSLMFVSFVKNYFKK